MSAPWNPNYLEVMESRIVRLHKLNANEELRDQIYSYYKFHPADWINDWCFTFDPRSVEMRVMPFVLFDRQREFVQFLWECLNDKENGLVEKARDIGASWLCCAFSVWLWLFWPGSAIGWGSRKVELVDKPLDPKAIFPKIRQIIQHLPPIFRPKGFVMDKHATHLKIVNPENDSTITGEGGDNIGRGGRTTIYFKDESAHYEQAEMIEASLGDNTNVQIDISSVNGSGNVFHRKRENGIVWHYGEQIDKGRTRVFIFDWRDHPLKTQEWYDLRRAEAERIGLLHVFLQEVDRDYAGSQARTIIPAEWIEAAIDSDEKLKLHIIGEKIGAQDVADGGNDKNAFGWRHGIKLMYAEHWGGQAGDAAAIALTQCVSNGVRDLMYDCIGVGSGFKVGWNMLAKMGKAPATIKLSPWDASSSPQHPLANIIPGDRQSPTNENFYKNQKAQGWWMLRTRFQKTYLAVTRGESFPPDELICLPSTLKHLAQIKMELKQPQYDYDSAGLLLVDKTPDGTPSPNLGDMIMMLYHPVRAPKGFFDVS